MDTLLDEARRHGLRITRSRMLVAREISEQPLTAQEIFVRIIRRRGRIDLASVYRILDAFVALGAVREITLGDGNSRYEKSDGAHHHHLICTVCGSVSDVEMNEAAMIRQLRRRTDFSVTRHMLEFFGVCRSCRRSPQ